MFFNYLKIAFRNIYRNKIFSFINIAGLAVGLAVCFCIIIYITYELSYDKQNKNYDNIYRVESDWSANDWRSSFTCIPLAEAAKENIPGIRSYARVSHQSRDTIIYSNKNLSFKDEYFADPTIFDVFTFKFLHGNSKSALNDLHSIVLSAKSALKIFGKTDVVGKLLTIKHDSISIPVKIAAIFRHDDSPATIKPDLILPLRLLYKLNKHVDPNDWVQIQQVNTYLLLNNNSDIKLLEKQLKKIYDNGAGKEVASMQDLKYHVVPLSQSYFVFKGLYAPSWIPVIDKEKLYIYSAIALLVLILACINFVLLSAAKFSTRNIEIGIRKVIGARRKDIALLLIFESIITTILAFPIALLFIELLFPYFKEIINRDIPSGFYTSFSFFIYFISINVVVGILSGIYTTYTVSKAKPVEVLRKRFGKAEKRINLKRILISLQMIIFIGLIISAIILKAQMELTHKIDLGFDVNNMLMIRCNGLNGKQNVFKNSLSGYPGIKDMAFTLNVFPYIRGNRFGVTSAENPGSQKSFGVPNVGYNYPKLVHMKLIAGNFPTADNYRGKTIINETAVRQLGLKSPVGKTIVVMNRIKKKIIGVVKDFHINSLRDKIRPVAMHFVNANFYLLIKYSPGKRDEVLSFIKGEWKKISDKPIDITYLDERIDELYKNELRFSKAVDLFTILAILIAGMGLFGIVLFSTQQRIKEIGIRKILGASIFEIINLFLKEILLLICISAIIAGPIAYYFMNKWLLDFAYRVEINWWIYALAFGITLLITFVATVFQIIKAANANPVESLRYE